MMVDCMLFVFYDMVNCDDMMLVDMMLISLNLERKLMMNDSAWSMIQVPSEHLQSENRISRILHTPWFAIGNVSKAIVKHPHNHNFYGWYKYHQLIWWVHDLP